MRQPGVYLIVGLGNPGSRYRDTRHNAGALVVDLWLRDLGIRLSGRKFQSRSAQVVYGNRKIIFLCPETFMNRSGASVLAAVNFYHVDMDRILVIHDDLDLSLGKVKLVRNGGSGGHKGVGSIIDQLGSRDFVRLKIGIGRPRYGEPVEDYVLAPFYDDEADLIQRVMQTALDSCRLFVEQDIETAMNAIHGKNLIHDKEVKS